MVASPDAAALARPILSTPTTSSGTIIVRSTLSLSVRSTPRGIPPATSPAATLIPRYSSTTTTTLAKRSLITVFTPSPACMIQTTDDRYGKVIGMGAGQTNLATSCMPPGYAMPRPGTDSYFAATGAGPCPAQYAMACNNTVVDDVGYTSLMVTCCPYVAGHFSCNTASGWSPYTCVGTMTVGLSAGGEITIGDTSATRTVVPIYALAVKLQHIYSETVRTQPAVVVTVTNPSSTSQAFTSTISSTNTEASTNTSSSDSISSSPSTGSSTHFSTSEKAGIAVGVIAGVLLLVGAVAFVLLRRRRRRRRQNGPGFFEKSEYPMKPELAANEVFEAYSTERPAEAGSNPRAEVAGDHAHELPSSDVDKALYANAIGSKKHTRRIPNELVTLDGEEAGHSSKDSSTDSSKDGSEDAPTRPRGEHAAPALLNTNSTLAEEQESARNLGSQGNGT